MLQVLAVFITWCLGIAGVLLVFRRLALRQQSRQRLELPDLPPSTQRRAGDDQLGLVSRWLFRAGYRHRQAAVRFVWATLACVALGVAGLVLLLRSGLIDQLTSLAGLVPGGVSDLLVPVAQIAPWLLFAELVAIPWFIVRSALRRRIVEIEQDLPLLLDLLATLSEAGLSFDAAVERIVSTWPGERVLPQEIRIYQAEVLAGRPRVSALRRIAWRVDVLAFSTFISALIHADQIGAGMAAVLRGQADDQRVRRRERALAFALSTPIKLMLPMIACFLPGIFVISLGPIFVKFFQMADGVFGGYGP